MGLNKFRNEPCHCGSGMKFKHCHLQQHQDQRARVVTALAKREAAKEQKYWKKRYERVTTLAGGGE